MRSFDGKYMNFYLMAIVMLAISYHLRDIRKTNKISPLLNLKMKANVKDEKSWTGAIPLEMFDSK